MGNITEDIKKEEAAKDKKPKGSKTASSKTRTPKQLETGLNELILQIGFFVSVVNPADGEAIINGAERLAESWAKLAAENKAIKKALETLLTSSTWGGVITSTAAVALPIMVNHNKIPPQIAAIFGGLANSTIDASDEEAPDTFEIPTFLGGSETDPTPEYSPASETESNEL